jgi:hypothetical protein
MMLEADLAHVTATSRGFSRLAGPGLAEFSGPQASDSDKE